MKNLGIIAVAAVLTVAPLAANAAPCTIGTCTVTDGPLSLSNPIAIQDQNVVVGAYEAAGGFSLAPGVFGADSTADVAFDQIIPPDTEVAAGFSNLYVDFFQGVEFLGRFTLTNDDGTTALQRFFLTFISDEDVRFVVRGFAFLNSGASLPDYNINLSASPVPVPGALPLLLSGIAGLSFASRRKKQAGSA